MKLIPVETGITKVKLALDNALKTTSIEIKIKTRAAITWKFKNRCIQSFKLDSNFPFRFDLISEAPETFNNAYKAQ
jgi:hypothetical protein